MNLVQTIENKRKWKTIPMSWIELSFHFANVDARSITFNEKQRNATKPFISSANFFLKLKLDKRFKQFLKSNKKQFKLDM